MLRDYNKKRNFNKTKEPIGRKSKSNKKLIFVIQHHLARKDHYDLRLEWNGVLISFAVPKGPSYNTKDKRLAIKVEDHPLEYKNFEGTIPKGEYGGGVVMLWDYGTWKPLTKPDFNKGIIKFQTMGKRMKGLWTLVYMSNNNWLLIKDKDQYYEYKNIKRLNTSIKSGKTFKEIKDKTSDIKLTNPDKIIYNNLTKGQIYNYYKLASKRMLPLINNRLLSVVRCPNGYNKGCFYKKHLENLNNYLGKKKVKNKNYYYIKDEMGLLSEVQMNSYEFHIWGSKIDDINHPDILVFDLDPDEQLSLNKLREGVKDLKQILDKLKLKSYLKTSGGKGYHILVPIKGITWKEAKKITQNIAKLMEETWPKKYTSNIKKNKRKGKIFIDWQRNIKGATSVAPYSLRLKDKPRISMPIKWSELDKIKPNEITIDLAIKRLKNKNPWEGFI